MTMLVSVDELRDFMSGIRLDRDQQSAAEMIIEGLQAEAESYCARPLEPGRVTEVVYPDSVGRYFLSKTPVTRILTIAGQPAAPGALGDLLHHAYLPYVPGVGLLAGVEVTYEYGISEQDQKFVRLAILRAAAREMEQRHDDTRSVKDLSSRNEGEMQLRQKVGFQPDELVKFDRLRRRVVVT